MLAPRPVSPPRVNLCTVPAPSLSRLPRQSMAVSITLSFYPVLLSSNSNILILPLQGSKQCLWVRWPSKHRNTFFRTILPILRFHILPGTLHSPHQVSPNELLANFRHGYMQSWVDIVGLGDERRWAWGPSLKELCCSQFNFARACLVYYVLD
jgi:hypothetical protein